MQAAETFTDTSLREEVDSFGRRMQRAEVLESYVRHQIHHRGQMTVLMWQAGLVVPGLYGPSREERAKLGLPPAK